MKMRYLYLIYCLLNICFITSGQGKIIMASSGWKNINTIKIFNAESIQDKVVYFDKQDKVTTVQNAYYIRRARFNDERIPEGVVQDYYLSGMKKKFIGSYYNYNPDNEKLNDKFQGICEFYGEDGSQTTKVYQNGELLEEKKVMANGKLIYEMQLNTNKTKKYYEEHLYDEKGTEIGVIQGRYNSVLKAEEFRKRLFSSTGKTIADIDYIGECPKNKATYYAESGLSFPVLFQDFSCEPNNEWLYSNFEIFDKFFDKSRKAFQLKSNRTGEAFLYLPTPNDFQKKPFEITASFEKMPRSTTPEFGMTWHFQDTNNYAYFSVNLENQTFEINAKINGEVKKYMTGIRNQINIENTTSTIYLKVTADPANNTFQYFVNDQAIIGYNKFPNALLKDIKVWNIGYFIKSKEQNNAIELKKFEIKMF